jgi:WD40 repeat protein
MAVGGVEGELLVYCNVDPSNPVKIWGTKFKRKNNVMLMTNAVQIVRWRRENGTYRHMLFACMNEAGVLVYNLPPHSECGHMARNFPKRRTRNSKDSLTLHSHLRDFHHSPINDARVSPDGNRIVFVGDDSYLYLRDVLKVDDEASSGISFGPTQVLTIPARLLSPYSSNTQQNARTSSDNETTPQPYSSQHVAWNNDSSLFAHTSDSHYCVLVWAVETQEIVIAIDAAGFTYAVAFHPSVRSVLAFSNRYGYFHTVDLDQAISVDKKRNTVVEEKLLTSVEANHDPKSVIERNQTVIPRQEITMVSFRGEKNTKLRILAKINGLRWSGCGRYLYVATKKRVLVYEFLSRCVKTLAELAGDQARKTLELDPLGWRIRQRLTTHSQSQGMLTRKRKRLLDESFDYESWYRQWKRIPEHLQCSILGDNVGLANHD